MRVLVCGGRDFTDESVVFGTLDRVLSKYGDRLVIIHGACPTGADSLAEKWAKDREVPYCAVPAQWKKHKRSAGPKRNKRMRDATEPQACIAFPGGTGTQNMVDLMREVGVEPWLVGWRAEAVNG